MSLVLLFNQQTSTPTIALVQETTGHASGSSLGKAFTSSVTTGNLLVIALTDAAAVSGTSLGISDSQGNTYTQASLAFASGIGKTAIWCAVANATGTNTVTTTSNATSPNLFAYLNEFSSPTGWASSPFDTSTVATGTGLTANSGSITTANDGELIFGFFPNGIQTPQSGYTLITDANAVEYQVQATAGSISASGTQFISGAWQAFIAAFKPTVPAAVIYTKSITVDHTQVPSTQTNFALLVNLTSSSLKSIAHGGHVHSGNGYDILVTSDLAGTTLLSWEVESYDPVAGTVVLWVNIPSLSSTTDTVFYLQYGNSAITTDQSNPSGVWDSSYGGVWHLADGTTLSAKDSTSNGNDGTITAATATAGQIGGGASFDGSSTWINMGSGVTSLQPTSALTASIWVKPTGTQPDNAVLLGQDYINPRNTPWCSYKIGINEGNAGQYAFDISTTTVSLAQIESGVSYTTGSWAYVVVTYDGATAAIYVNGVLKNTNSITGPLIYSNGDFVLSGDSENQEEMLGVLDEARVLNVARTSDWIAIEYANQNSGSTLLTVGTEQLKTGSAFTKALTDSVTFAEALLRQINKQAIDSLSITEAVQRQTNKHTADSFSITESIQRAAGRIFSDAFSIAESLGRSTTRQIADAFSLTEAIGRSAKRVFTDSLTITETIAKTASHTVTEAFTLADSIASQTIRLFTQMLSETFSVSESFSRYSQKQASDALTISDVMYRTGQKVTLDSFTITEQIARTGKKVWLDTFTIAESITRSGQKAFTDSVSLAEQFICTLGRVLATDALTVTDYTVAKQGQKVALEAFTVTDYPIVRVVQKIISTAFTLAEQIARTTQRTITDAFSLSDVLSKAHANVKLFAESFILSDFLTRSVARSVIDSLTLSDALEAAGGKILFFLESFSITESFTKSVRRQISESFNLTDVFAGARSKFFALIDALSITDTINKQQGRTVSDSLTISDSYSRSTGKNVAESFSILEQIGKATTHAFTDALSVLDQLGKLTARKVTDAFSLSDTVSSLRSKALMLVEAFTLSENIVRRTTRNFLDAIGLIEIFSAGGTRALEFLEAIALSDQITRKPTKSNIDVIVVSDDGIIRHTVHEINEPIVINEWLVKQFSHVFTDLFTLGDRIIKGLDTSVDAITTYCAEVLRRFFTAEISVQQFTAEVFSRAYTAGEMQRVWTANEDIMIYADPKDAESTEDFQIDWTAVIGSDTITDSSWEVPSDLTSVSSRNTATTATVRISGGTANKRYTVKNLVTLESGQIRVQSMTIVVI